MRNFVKGALFMILITPLVDGITSLCSQCVEYLCTAIAVHTYKLKSILEDEETKATGGENTYAMGFPLYNESTEDEYDDEEEESE